MPELEGLVWWESAADLIEYRLHQNDRATVDAWLRLAHEHDLAYAETGRHRRSLSDLRGIHLTPHLVTAVMQVARRTPPGLRESVAVLLEDSLMLWLSSALLKQLPAAQRQATRLFQREAEARQWLDERRRLLSRPEDTP
ncbi:MAG: hypothetical protein MUE40_16280 [Anaerolineae bacterium]|jgi:hypothetical protein|nr:hypothetical protein [Anaerolineae bacterium]